MIVEDKKVKIKWIEFENFETTLKVERINFFDDITLLVGLSGAGKTQILDAIEFSLMLALDKVKIMLPYKVCIGIEINNQIYEWSYALKKDENNSDLIFENAEEYIFISEKLSRNKQIIFTREKDCIQVDGFVRVPTPKKNKSLIYQYSDDLEFDELVSELKKLYNIDNDFAIRRYMRRDTVNTLKINISKALQTNSKTNFKIFSHLPSPLKLYIAKNYYNELYEQILYSVQEIFAEIRDIDIVEDHNRDCYCVQINVYGQKIHQKNISNGMLKTIFLIVDLYTASDNSLIMIDEFENGLGINCIDSISEFIMEERHDVQFIITSHHPKIIGNIDYHSWKIIEREQNIVKNFDCNDPRYDLGGNRHDAYYNLINKWAFEDKI